jgi:hypothetical protein
METELSKERAERERRLWMASEQYMRGEITVEDFEKIEGPYSSELIRATLEHAKQSLYKQARESINQFVSVAFILGFIVLIGVSIAVTILTKNAFSLALLPLILLISNRVVAARSSKK